MANPLSERSSDSLNRSTLPTSPFTKTPSTILRSVLLSTPDAQNFDEESLTFDHTPSSPFQANTQHSRTSDSSREGRSLSLSARSPTKTFAIHEDTKQDSAFIPLTPSGSGSPQRLFVLHSDEQIKDCAAKQHGSLSDFTLAQPKLTRESYDKTIHSIPADEDEEHDNHSTISDDTCFSAFSAVPNADMTLFAKLGEQNVETALSSPTRLNAQSDIFHTPSTSRRHQRIDASRSTSPTPRGERGLSRRDGDTTNLLLDFTQQYHALAGGSKLSPTKRFGSPTKSDTTSNLLSHINNQRIPSPSKGCLATSSNRKTVMTLLDFDLPPQPTPRSLPSITIRELETLKSQYLSEISSLKASLSGREAEVESLKKAVVDAEQRVGQAQEQVREERSAREHAETGRKEWEQKGHDSDILLQNMREEFLYVEKEKEEALQKLRESERKREENELRLAEAATKIDTFQAGPKIFHEDPDTQKLSETEITRQVNQQLDEKMENLARELHAVYKKKHEAKVATLKKTYELRAEKRCGELNKQIEELSKQSAGTRMSRDASTQIELVQQLESQRVELEERRIHCQNILEELRSTRESNTQLLHELECERTEKGELVAAVDEMLALQSDSSASNIIEDLRRSTSRAPSKLPGVNSTMKASGIPGKSRMMSNIQRMQ